MQLFYAPDFTPSGHTLGPEESKHCIRVLRLERGATVHITDGRGNLFCCRIIEASPHACRVEAVDVQRNYGQMPYRLRMAVAPTKNADRFEWFLEKATEVGVTEVIPLETEHSERRTYKPERGEKILTAAMKQSLKAYRPLLHPLTPLHELLAVPAAEQRLIAHCAPARSAEGKQYLPHALQPGGDALVLIGPEGDFSAAEIDSALAAGCREITLGPQRLRTETAAVAAVVMAAVVNTLS